MSMSDLFGSDEGSEASDEDFNLTKEKIANGNENNVSSSDEQSGVEDVNDVEGDENGDDDGDDDDDMGLDKNAENGEDEQDENEQNNENSENEESSGNEEQSDTEQKDEEKPSSKNVSSMDLFGEDVSSEDDDDEPSAKDEKETTVMEASTQEEDLADDDTHQGNVQSDDEDATDEPEETHINIEIPYSKFSLGSEMSFVKLPNFLSVETKPFDATTYEDEFEEDEVMDDEGRSRLKLRVENTIRWRYAKDEEGNDIKESNARIVRWSDGTMSLLLGAEVFDIHKTKIDGEHNHLFVQQGTGLQAQAIFRDKLTFRPHSTNSQTHRKMTLSIADRVSKTGKIKILPVVGKDPESQKSELIKKEEEKLRSQLRKENQQRRIRERSIARGLSASYLEGRNDDDDDTLESSEQSLLALKRRYKKNIAKVRLGMFTRTKKARMRRFPEDWKVMMTVLIIELKRGLAHLKLI